MAIITLTSDWGYKDYYLASVKGMIYSYLPEVNIVDISHGIKSFDIVEGAFVVKNSYSSFPEGSIHIIGLSTEESISHCHTVVYYDNHYFIGTDNGIFSMIFDHKPQKIFELDVLLDSSVNTFSTRDRFVKAATHLYLGNPIEELGPKKDELVSMMLFEPSADKNGIKGIVSYIDNFENLITNISFELFNKHISGKKFEISFNSYKITSISNSYADVRPGNMVALFASNGMLEIAINRSKAASLLGMKKRSTIIIRLI